MKPSYAKRDCIFCSVDVQVNLVEPGPTQNHANTPDVGPQKSVLTAQNIFETVSDFNHCNVTLIDLQRVTSYYQKFF